MALLIFFVETFVIFSFGSKNYTKCTEAVLVYVISVPISASNYINTVSLLKIGSIDVLEIAVMELLLVGILTRNLFTIRIDKIIVNSLVLLFIYLFNVFLNWGSRQTIADAKDYILPLVLFFCIYISHKERGSSWNVFVDCAITGLRINSILLIVGYIFYWLPSGIAARYGFPNECLYLFSIPLEFVKYGNQKVRKSSRVNTNLFFGFLQTGLIFISQTRSLIICLICIWIMFFLVTNFYKTSRKKMLKKIVLIMLGILLCIFVQNIIGKIEHNIAWMKRMNEILEAGFLTNSNQERLKLLEYYLPLIIDNPLGYGFGTRMSSFGITSAGNFIMAEDYALGVDNLILTYLYKLGVVALVIYIVVYLIAYSKLLKNFSAKEYSKKGLIVKISMIALLLPCVFLSCQALLNFPVACFFWSFVFGSRDLKGEDKW